MTTTAAASKECTVLAIYKFKTNKQFNGTRCTLVRNGEGKVHKVWTHSNGCASSCSCDGFEKSHGRKCYHIKHVEAFEAAKQVVVTPEPVAETKAADMEQLANVVAAMAADVQPEQAAKEPVIRHQVAAITGQQAHIVSYDVLDKSQEYYMVCMENGRGRTCTDHLGNKCSERREHPSVPCRHMQAANLAEEKHRQAEHVEAFVRAYNLPAPQVEVFRQFVQKELDKCTEAFQAVVRRPINQVRGTAEWWQAAERRDKAAKRAKNKQYALSQKRIKAFAEQQLQAA